MRNLRKLSGLALALLSGAPCAAWAQAVAVPAAPAPAAVAVPAPAAVVAPAPAAVAAPTRNLWTFLCLTPEQKARCKARFCGSQFGKLINNSLAPMSTFTGGVIPQPCPPIDPAVAAAAGPESALGAAAAAQADTAQAAARRAAIRYLSTVDCNWWPEATAALINSLRADKNECVRLEAAVALQRGCCCNQFTIRALVNSLSVFPDDDNPREDSPRVRAAAMGALQHCLACFVAIAPPPPPPPPPVIKKEGPPPPGEVPPVKGPALLPPPPPVPPAQASVADAQSRIRPAAYHVPAQDQSMEQVVQHARRVLQQAQEQSRRPVAPFQAGERSLLEVIENALHAPAPQPAKGTRLASPPQIAAKDRTIAEPPVFKPEPQLPPRMLPPQPKVIPAAGPAPIVTPAPAAPVSLKPTRPTAAPSSAANSSYVTSQTPASSWVPAKPAPQVNLWTPPTAVVASAPAAKEASAPPENPQVQNPHKSDAPVRGTAASAAGASGLSDRENTSNPTPTDADQRPRISPPLPTSINPPPPAAAPSTLANSSTSTGDTPIIKSAPVPPVAPAADTTTMPTIINKPERPSVSKPAEPEVSTPVVQPLPVSLKPSQPAVAPSSAENSSHAASHTPVNTWAPSLPAPQTADSWTPPAAVVASVPAPMEAPVPPANPTPIDAGQRPTVSQLLALLKSSESPKTRQWAARTLTGLAGPSPTVVEALENGAAADTSDAVRDACLHGLLHFGVADPELLAKVDWPQMDDDPHVREAAWRHVLFGTEASGNPRVREAAKALNQWLQNQSPGRMPGRS